MKSLFFIFRGLLSVLLFLPLFVSCITCGERIVPAPLYDGGTTDGGIMDGGMRKAKPFVAITAGGEKAESVGYRVNIFVAPVEPVGSMESSAYKVKVGPAGIRKPCTGSNQ